MGTKQIAKNTLFLYVRMGFSLIVSLFTVRIILGALGDVDYGIFNVVAGFVSMLGFMSVSLVNGVQRFYNYELGRVGVEGVANVYRSAKRIQLILSVAIIAIIETVGLWYLNYKMVIPADRLLAANILMQLTLLSLLMNMMAVPFTAAMIAKEKFDAYAYIGIADVVLKLAIAFVVFYIPSHKLVVYGALLLSISILNIALYYCYCRRKFPELFASGRFDRKLTIEMAKFMGWNTIGSGAYIFRAQGLNLLLNYFFGVVLNAANGIATQISGAVQNFALNLVTAFKPQMVQEYAAGNSDRSFELMVLMTKVSFALVYILSVPIILDMDYILTLWLGNDVPPYTADLTILVLISMCISCLHTPIVQMIQTIGKMGRFQIATSIIIMATIPLSWVAFHFGGGPQWAYYAAIIVYALNQIAALIILRTLYSFSIIDYLKNAILPCLAFAVLLPVLPTLFSLRAASSAWQLIFLCLISLVVSFPLAYCLVLNASERSSLREFIKHKLS